MLWLSVCWRVVDFSFSILKIYLLLVFIQFSVVAIYFFLCFRCFFLSLLSAALWLPVNVPSARDLLLNTLLLFAFCIYEAHTPSSLDQWNYLKKKKWNEMKKKKWNIKTQQVKLWKKATNFSKQFVNHTGNCYYDFFAIRCDTYLLIYFS